MFISHPRTTDLSARYFPSHIHSEFEMLYFAHGDADYMIEGAVYALCKGDLLIIKPRTFHNLLPRSNAYYERFIVFFSEKDVGADICEKAAKLPDVISAAPEALVTGFFASWGKLAGQMSEAELFAFVSAGIRMLVTALYFSEPGARAPSVRRAHAHLQSVLGYIDSHPNENITLEALSQMFYISPSWLTHTFKRKMGVSIMRYAEQKRILYAGKLIEDGTDPTKAAELCGYDNYSTFFRQYKKRFGVSPREGKKKRRRNT